MANYTAQAIPLTSLWAGVRRFQFVGLLLLLIALSLAWARPAAADASSRRFSSTRPAARYWFRARSKASKAWQKDAKDRRGAFTRHLARSARNRPR